MSLRVFVVVYTALWAMGLPFAAGHFLTAVILYWNLERDRHDSAD